MLKLVAVTGFAGAGKDTIRLALEAQGFVGLAFAEPLKRMLAELYGISGVDYAYMENRELKEKVIPAYGVSYRQMAQTLGTEWGRSLHPNFWTKVMHARVDELYQRQGVKNIVVSDLRFLNEAAWVRMMGGEIWRVERPNLAGVRPHVSESELLNIEPDQVIHNTGSIADLEEAARRALNG